MSRRLIIRPRGGGKTWEAIKAMRLDPSIVLVTFASGEARRLIDAYPDMVGRIWGWQDYIERHQRGYHRPAKIAVDNADMILQNMLENPIEIITMNEDDTPVKPGMSRL